MIKWLFFPVMLAFSAIGILTGVWIGLWLKTFPGHIIGIIGNFAGGGIAAILAVIPLLVYVKIFGDDER